jgi:hypothetical protein
VTLECLHTVCQSDASPSCRGEEGIRCPLRLSPPAACAPGAPPPLNTLRPSWRVEATPFLPHTQKGTPAHSLRGLKQCIWQYYFFVGGVALSTGGVQVSAALPAGRQARSATSTPRVPSDDTQIATHIRSHVQNIEHIQCRLRRPSRFPHRQQSLFLTHVLVTKVFVSL